MYMYIHVHVHVYMYQGTDCIVDIHNYVHVHVSRYMKQDIIMALIHVSCELDAVVMLEGLEHEIPVNMTNINMTLYNTTPTRQCY